MRAFGAEYRHNIVFIESRRGIIPLVIITRLRLIRRTRVLRRIKRSGARGRIVSARSLGGGNIFRELQSARNARPPARARARARSANNEPRTPQFRDQFLKPANRFLNELAASRSVQRPAGQRSRIPSARQRGRGPRATNYINTNAKSALYARAVEAVETF